MEVRRLGCQLDRGRGEIGTEAWRGEGRVERARVASVDMMEDSGFNGGSKARLPVR